MMFSNYVSFPFRHIARYANQVLSNYISCVIVYKLRSTKTKLNLVELSSFLDRLKLMYEISFSILWPFKEVPRWHRNQLESFTSMNNHLDVFETPVFNSNSTSNVSTNTYTYYIIISKDTYHTFFKEKCFIENKHGYIGYIIVRVPILIAKFKYLHNIYIYICNISYKNLKI